MPRPLIPVLALTLLTVTACLPTPAADRPGPLASPPSGVRGVAEPAAAGRTSPSVRPRGSANLTARAGLTVMPVGHARDTPAYGPKASDLVGRSKRWGRAGREVAGREVAGRDGREVAERAERLTRRLSRRPRTEPPRISLGDSGEKRARAKRRPRPVVSVPDVRLYEDAVCVDTPRSRVHIGRCHVAGAEARRSPAPAVTRHSRQVATPTPTPTKTEPAPTPRAKIHVARQELPQRPNPLGTVLLMVVLTTVIAATTAVAFGAVK